jgi:hypothetical protein
VRTYALLSHQYPSRCVDCKSRDDCVCCVAASQPALKQDFQLLVCALLAGHNGSLDGLTKHNNKLLVTMEDYLWVKLSLVSTTTQGTAAAAASGGAGSSMLSAGGGQQAAGG